VKSEEGIAGAVTFSQIPGVPVAGGGTVTVAVSVCPSLLDAMTWKIPIIVGAVYVPSLATLPPLGPSCTANAHGVLQVNFAVPPSGTVAVRGEIESIMLPPSRAGLPASDAGTAPFEPQPRVNTTVTSWARARTLPFGMIFSHRKA
jgi:hypothetical protein